MRIVIATLSILFAVCVVIVSLVNTDPVTVRLWPDSPEYTYPDTKMSWVIFFSAVSGIVFTGIIAIIEGSKIRLSNARLRGQVRRLQQEVETLKRPSLEFDSAPTPAQVPAHEPVEIDEETG